MQDRKKIFLYMKEEIERLASNEAKVYLDQATISKAAIEKQVSHDASAKADMVFSKQQEQLEKMYIRKIADQKVFFQSQLIEKRTKYVNELMDTAKQELQKFVSSDQYLTYLIDSIKSTNQKYPMDNIEVNISVNDIKYEKQIQDCFEKEISIKVNDQIKIGGFMLKDYKTSILMNQTLDQKLLQQRNWITQLEELKIK